MMGEKKKSNGLILFLEKIPAPHRISQPLFLKLPSFLLCLRLFVSFERGKKKREREGNETPEPASDLKVLICLAIAKCQFPPWK